MKILSSKLVFQCPIFNVEEREVEHGNGTRATHWVVLHIPNVQVVALTPSRQIVFVRVQRGTKGDALLELPGGKVMDFTPSEDALREQAIEELQTESGFTANELEQVFHTYQSLDWMEREFFYYAAWNVQTGEAEPEAGERITVEPLDVAEVERRMSDGQFPGYLLTPLQKSLDLFRNKGLI